jgi:hypothetical protein
MPARRSLDGAGSTTNSPNGCTIHADPAHPNHPAEPFLKGLHTLAQRSAGYPGYDSQERFIPQGNASGDLASTRLIKRSPLWPHHAARSTLQALHNPPSRAVTLPRSMQSLQD